MADYTDQHAKRFPRMWWKLGTIFEVRALELANIDASPERALRMAQAAEACFWQATGEGDFVVLGEIAQRDPT